MPPSENKPQEKNPIKALRTYQGDVEDALGKNKVSKATIMVAEQKRKEAAPPEPAEISGEIDTRKRNKIFIWSGITLFILGIAGVSVTYYIKSENQIAVVKQTKALIGFSEEIDSVWSGLTKTSVQSQVAADKKSFNSPVNSVLYVNYVTADKTSITTQDFLSVVAPQMPGSLQRSFEDKYMLGVIAYGANEPFIILTTNDYAESYSGMLSWEKNMAADVGPIFGISSVASTTVFSDEALQNKDLRILKNTAGKTVLAYSFIDRNTLVIASSENIITAILGKYIISKQAR